MLSAEKWPILNQFWWWADTEPSTPVTYNLHASCKSIHWIPALTDSATTLALSSTLRTSSKPSTATCAAAPATGPSWRPSPPSAPTRARPLNPRRLTSPSSRTIAPREMTQVCIEFILDSIRGKDHVRWQHLSWMKDRLICFRKTIFRVVKNALV